MGKPNEYASVVLDVDAGTRPQHATPEPETPFRILVLGDFGGSVDRTLKPVLVDRDNFDEILAHLAVELTLGAGTARPIHLTFRELDHFHPDHIYGGNPLFRSLRETRRRLNDPATFAQAAAEVAAWSGSAAPAAPAAPAPPRPSSPAGPSVASIAGGSLLDEILDAGEPETVTPSQSRDPLHAFIQQSLAPHLQPRASAELPDLLEQVDSAAGKLMRAILHHPAFQALESAWRAMYRLIRGLETGTQLKVYLLDLPKSALAGELEGAAFRNSRLGRILTDPPAEGGWAVVAANYAFDRSSADVALLSRLGRLMSIAGSPLIAEADPGGEPDPSAEESSWARLRRSPDAAWIALSLPRFLLRLPYGAETGATEEFRFEECAGVPAHGDYLWANPAFACAQILGETFSGHGWRLRPGAIREISGLPLHVYNQDGESQLRPCVELPLTPDDVEWALDEGYMPWIWQRGQDSIRMARFQSIASPPQRLSGPWI